jgi:hypothetical protein
VYERSYASPTTPQRLVGILKELWNSIEGVAFDQVTRKTTSALSRAGAAHKGSLRAPYEEGNIHIFLNAAALTKWKSMLRNMKAVVSCVDQIRVRQHISDELPDAQ